MLFLFQAAVQQYRTVLKYPGDENTTDPRTGQVRDPANLYTWSIGGEYTAGTNILGLVFFAGDHAPQRLPRGGRGTRSANHTP